MPAPPPPPIDLTPFGLAVGHATDAAGATGCTVVRGVAGPFRAASALLGRASATRELAVTAPEHLVDRVDAILLTGGSAYGLDAAAGVMRWHEVEGRGFPVGAGVVPIVPAAAVFDLAPCGRFDARPTPTMAHQACEVARPIVDVQGSVGAGTGCTVGKVLGAGAAMKGGFGAAIAGEGATRCVALAVVNALGDVCDAAGQVLAGARLDDGRFADARQVLARGAKAGGAAGARRFADAAGRGAPAGPMGNTTLAVVATTAALDPVALQQLARAASAALLRRITPCGTAFDGDVVFAVAPLPEPGAPVDAPRSGPDVLQVEMLAVVALEAAIERAVRHAVGRDGIPGLADVD
jgi:L-aminopeptidase/D-esterase-like protein